MDDQWHPKSQDYLAHQHVCHSVRAFILDGECFSPLTEVVSDYPYIAVAIRCGVTDVQDIHRDTIPPVPVGMLPNG